MRRNMHSPSQTMSPRSSRKSFESRSRMSSCAQLRLMRICTWTHQCRILRSDAGTKWTRQLRTSSRRLTYRQTLAGQTEKDTCSQRPKLWNWAPGLRIGPPLTSSAWQQRKRSKTKEGNSSPSSDKQCRCTHESLLRGCCILVTPTLRLCLGQGHHLPTLSQWRPMTTSKPVSFHIESTTGRKQNKLWKCKLLYPIKFAVPGPTRACLATWQNSCSEVWQEHAIVRAFESHNAALPGPTIACDWRLSSASSGRSWECKCHGIQTLALSHVPAISRCKESAISVVTCSGPMTLAQFTINDRKPFLPSLPESDSKRFMWSMR